jgi:hypothetical protein
LLGKSPCYIESQRANKSVLIVARHHSGAVKSNVGHLEGASGIAGVIKAIMVLEKGIIPPNANFESLNPKIDAEFLNIKASGTLLCTYSIVFLTCRAVSLERNSMAYKWLAKGISELLRLRWIEYSHSSG